MGFSNLAEVSIRERRLLLSKYPPDIRDRLGFKIPENYLFFSLLCLKNLTKVLENKDPLPTAIIVDLDIFTLDQISSVIGDLKYNSTFSNIPIIGIKRNNDNIKPSLVLKAGLDDCFFGLVNWTSIKERVQFLTEHKGSFEIPSSSSLSYSMPIGKRVFDFVSAAIGLLLLSPLLIVVAALIKLESKGPIFYTSKRIGTGYQEFDFIKFRSMKTDADEQLKKLAHLNSYEGKSDSKNAFFKIKNDPRVTRVGKVIRKTSIDELPQLINVLRGEMSIIGNRPLPLYEAEKMTKDDWAGRFMAPAGLTGLWQVDKRGKDNLSAEERVALDVSYAKGVSLLTDVKILLRTLPAMWQRS